MDKENFHEYDTPIDKDQMERIMGKSIEQVLNYSTQQNWEEVQVLWLLRKTANILWSTHGFYIMQ